MKKATITRQRPGRPATGREPNAVYVANSRTNLVQAGGKRLEVRLSPDDVGDLQEVMRHHEADQQGAARIAIRTEAARIRRLTPQSEQKTKP